LIRVAKLAKKSKKSIVLPTNHSFLSKKLIFFVFFFADINLLPIFAPKITDYLILQTTLFN